MPTSKGNIVLVHGLWMTPSSWDKWIERYTKAGYNVIAPGWPGTGDKTVTALKADSSSMEGVSIKDVVDSYEKIILTLESPPIIMGHSFGGMFTQILLDRGLGSAGEFLYLTTKILIQRQVFHSTELLPLELTSSASLSSSPYFPSSTSFHLMGS
jgi:pimeloyl-ACP methyl ester carboxylesterase